MPYYCAVKGCSNSISRTRKKQDIIYHTFPKQKERLEKWIKYCHREDDWKPNQSHGICSDHFDPTSYDKKFRVHHEDIGAKIRGKLLPNALPGVVINESNVFESINDAIHETPVEHNRLVVTEEECYEEEMLIEKLDDSDNQIVTELKIEPRSPFNAIDDQPNFDVNLSYNSGVDSEDIKEELNEELIEIPLPRVELLTNPVDIPTENQLINKFCRLCLRKISKLFPLMSRIQDVLVPEMYHAVTGVDINLRDMLPKKVCMNCLIRIDYAYNIRKEFLEAHRTLHDFAMARVLPLLDDLHHYQKDIRLTTESYGEKIFRQHKDVIRMRLIKKQKHLEELAENEVLDQFTRNMSVEKFKESFSDNFPKDKTDPPKRHEDEDSKVEVDSDTTIDQAEEYLEEDKIEDKTVEVITVKQNTSPQSVSNKTSAKEPNTNEPQQQKQEKRRKGRLYNVEMTETKPDPNKCYICEDVFEDKDKLHVHLPTHVDMIPYSCERCVEEGGETKKFTSLILLHRHFRMHAGSIKCPNCPVRTFTSIGMYAHIAHYHRAYSAQNYTCEICGHQMVNKKRFETHLRFHKAIDEGRYQCNYCDKKFATKTRLTRHERSHTQERPYKCNYCDKMFSSETTLHGHERTHTGEKGFRCDICGKSYRTKSGLRDHVGLTHDDLDEPKKSKKKGNFYPTTLYFPEEMKCTFEGCDFSTKNRAKHYNHKAKHTLKFHCSHCSERFPTKQLLEQHEYVHTGVKPYCCDQCGKSFRFRNSFIEHMNGHENVRPYSCEVCGMAFVRERTLREHRLKHSNALTYKCRVCDKKFKYRADQSKHERTHTEADTDRMAFQYDSQGDADLIVEDG